MPLLSIIVTVYNLENYIEDCLNSILQQDCRDYELIVVNDGSLDKSADICEKYAKLYPDIVRFIDLPAPAALGRAHSVGFEQTKGKYIQMIDGDDLLAEDCLLSITEILKSKEPDVLMGTFECLLEPGAVGLIDAKIEVSKINNCRYEDAIAYLATLSSFHMIFVRYIFKKSLLNGQNLFHSDVSHTTTANDWLPATKIITLAESICYMPVPFYFYRRRASGSITSKITTKHLVDHFITVIELANFLNRSKLKGERLGFVLSRILLMLNIALAGEDLLTHVDWLYLGEVIGKYKVDFEVLKGCAISKLEQLCDFIDTYGSKEGVMLFCAYDRVRFLALLTDINNKDIYILPTGIKGQFVARLLKKEGVKVKAFLDNDSNKWEAVFEELPCYSPNLIKDFSAEEKRNTLVIVAPIYESLNSVFINQLKQNLLEHKNIIIKD